MSIKVVELKSPHPFDSDYFNLLSTFTKKIKNNNCHSKKCIGIYLK